MIRKKNRSIALRKQEVSLVLTFHFERVDSVNENYN